MASWQCVISVEGDINTKSMAVLCTGDEDAVITSAAAGGDQHYFFTQMVLPMSTFAVAIGQWSSLYLVKPENF